MRESPGQRVWQRNYFQRVVRNEKELEQTREYIKNNPANWKTGINYPENWNVNV